MAQTTNMDNADGLVEYASSETNLPEGKTSVLGLTPRNGSAGEQLRPSPSFVAATRTPHHGCSWLPAGDSAVGAGAKRIAQHVFDGADRRVEAVPPLRSEGARSVGLLADLADPSGRLVPTEVLIIDDSTLQRENLATILCSDGTLTPSVAWDQASALAAIDETVPGIVLLNMATTDKMALLRAIGQECPSAKVIVVGISESDEEDIIACAEAGVAGYHLRTESLYELLSLITKVVDGESACSPRVSAILLKRLSSLASRRRTGPDELALTTREMQILRMLEVGYSNKDIAEQLCIALHTVKNHVHSVLGKLGVSTRAEAAALSRSSH